MAHAEGQQHPISVYLWIWLLLFVFSFFSYMVDYLAFEGMLRWSLILLFMLIKAGLIVSIFMHMAWERLALTYAILLPPVLVLVFVALMTLESDYTFASREIFFALGS
jgi:cytochrome c oxidase subunit IV